MPDEADQEAMLFLPLLQALGCVFTVALTEIIVVNRENVLVVRTITLQKSGLKSVELVERFAVDSWTAFDRKQS